MEKTTIKKRKKRFTLKQWIFYWAVLAFPLLQFFIFYVYINFNSVLFAFQRYDLQQGKFIFDGVENFKAVFHEIKTTAYLKTAFKNSVIVLFAKVAIGTTFALLFSYYIFKKRRGSEVFRTFLFLPSVISPVCLVIIFTYLADQAIPTVAEMLFGVEMFGVLTYQDQLFSILLIYALFMGFGYQVLLFSGSMGNVSESTLEAATLDGANAIQEFIFIVLPGIWGTFVTFIVVQIAALFTEQMNLFSFYGGGAPYSTQTIGYYLYTQASVNEGVFTAYPKLSAFGLLMTLITLVITLGVKRLLGKFGPKEE